MNASVLSVPNIFRITRFFDIEINNRRYIAGAEALPTKIGPFAAVRCFAVDRCAEWLLDWDRALVVCIDIGNYLAPDSVRFVWPIDFVFGVECLAVDAITPVWVAAHLDCPATIASPCLPTGVIWAPFGVEGLHAALAVKRSSGFEKWLSPGKDEISRQIQISVFPVEINSKFSEGKFDVFYHRGSTLCDDSCLMLELRRGYG